jgi:hypothetical protein
MIMMWFYVSFQSGKHINLLNVTSGIQSFGDGDIYIAEQESFMQLSKNTFMATLVERISEEGQSRAWACVAYKSSFPHRVALSLSHGSPSPRSRAARPNS